MKMSHYLWLLWGAMFVALLMKGTIDARKFAETSLIIALIVLPILTVLLEMQEEVKGLKEEAKHQRKFVMERYNVLNEKMNDLTTNIEKKIVVDFSEFAKENPPTPSANRNSLGKKMKKKKSRPEGENGDQEQNPSQDFAKISKDSEPKES